MDGTLPRVSRPIGHGVLRPRVKVPDHPFRPHKSLFHVDSGVSFGVWDVILDLVQ